MITMYAIRHIHSGKFLPVTKKGNTRVEPCEPEEAPPRLIQTYRGAVLALNAWAKGEHHATWDYSDSEYGGGHAYVDDIRIKPIKGRVKEHMEIVRVTLHMEAV